MAPNAAAVDDDLLTELLPVYYRRLFPFGPFYRWLSYGNGKKKYPYLGSFTHSEFATLDLRVDHRLFWMVMKLTIHEALFESQKKSIQPSLKRAGLFLLDVNPLLASLFQSTADTSQTESFPLLCMMTFTLDIRRLPANMSSKML